MSEGFVYVLTNVAMPGYVKIGFTAQDSLETRLRSLDTTGVPERFDTYYAARVPDCRRLERTLHYVFGEKRVRANREFFKTDPDLAKAIIELVAIHEEPVAPDLRPPVEEPVIGDEPVAGGAIRKRSKSFTLAELGATVGSELVFLRDPSVTCRVVSERTVLFNGQELAVSAAALAAIRAMGYDWRTVNGYDYWLLDGDKLSALATLRRDGDPDRAQPESPSLVR